MLSRLNSSEMFCVCLQWLKRVDDPKFKSNNTIVISKQPFIILKSSEIGSGSDGTYLNKFVIHHVTEADGGMYICLAANTMGFSWRSAHLIVKSSKSQFCKLVNSGTFVLEIRQFAPIFLFFYLFL